MSFVKYILLSSFFILLIGLLFGKAIPLIPNSGEMLFFGFIAFILSSIVYGILALINKSNRIEAGMVALSIPIVLGLLFTLMHWPGGDILIITWSGTFLLISIGVCIYTLTRKRNSVLGVFYLSIGFGTLFFCFKFMRWPGDAGLYALFVAVAVGAIIFFYVQKSELTLSVGVSLVVIALYGMFFFCSESQLYRMKKLDVLSPPNNFPENYHIYAWLLYKEGRTEDAKANLELAIQEANNKYNGFAWFNSQDPGAAERYKRAMDSLDAGQWDDWERAPNYPH